MLDHERLAVDTDVAKGNAIGVRLLVVMITLRRTRRTFGAMLDKYQSGVDHY